MKWVKASERLPVINKNVIMRFPWHDNTIVLDEGKLKPKEERDNQLWFSTNNYGSIPERENGLEWLDESAESDSGEQVRKLREGLEGIGKSLYIGDDLKDKEVLDFYVEVVKNCKEYIKLLLTETEG